MAIGIANSPKKYDNGYCHATFVGMETFKNTETVSTSADDFDTREYTSNKFMFDVDGFTGKSIRMNLFTGEKLSENFEKIKAKGRGSKEMKIYNRLTTVCIALGVLKEEKLGNLSDEDVQAVTEGLEKMAGQRVMFKLKSRKNSNLHDINHLTLTLLKDESD